MRLLLPLVLSMLAGCSYLPSMPEIKLWPFGEEKRQDLDRRPQGSTEYRCTGNRAFYLRPIEDGAMWLIAPDREIRLPKLADGRYGVGRVLLEIRGEDATLSDPPASFVGCKRAPV